MPLSPELTNLAGRLIAPKRFVLLIGDLGALIVRLAGNTVQAHQFLSGDREEAIRQAGIILAAAQDLPVIVLFDIVGQTCRNERVPAVGFFDRPKILARKLETLFPGTELRGCVRLGAAKGGQRGYEYLFAALNQAPEIALWRKLLDEIANPIADIRLLPLESAGLLRRLAAPSQPQEGESNWRMLISQQRTGGFRQIVTRDHQLAIARMTPAPASLEGLDEIAGLLRREIGATIDYITRLGFDRGVGLEAVFIGRRDVCAALTRAQLPVRRLMALTPREAQIQADLTGAEDESGHFADLLHAAWGGSRLLSSLSVQTLRAQRARRIETTQAWATRLLAAASAAALLYGAILIMDLRDAESAYLQAEAARSKLQQNLDLETGLLDTGPVPVARIREFLEVKRQLEAGNLETGAVFKTIEQILPDNIRLRSLNISVEQRQPVLAEFEQEEYTDGPRAGDAPITGKILLTIDLSPFRNAVPAINETGRLADALRAALPDMRVRITRQPLHILPTDTLSVKPGENILASAGDGDIAEIELRGKLK